jgi:kynureninase
MQQLREKSMALTELFIALVEQDCAGLGLVLASPRAAAERGSHVSYRHPEGHAVMQALRGRGVIGDFRSPDLMRFGIAPLYIGYADVYDAVAHLAEVLRSGAWQREERQRRSRVT